jgi:hypothetical protein
MTELILSEDYLATAIYKIRHQKVILDRDIARLYGIPTKALKQAVRRNLDRFPSDFMFELSEEEFENWRSQIVASISNGDKMGLRYAPMAFTEQGVAMLSSVVNNQRAIEVNIAIMRTFVNMRQWIQQHENLREHLLDLEAVIMEHDGKFERIFNLLSQLKEDKNEPRRLIGFSEPEPPAYGKPKHNDSN